MQTNPGEIAAMDYRFSGGCHRFQSMLSLETDFRQFLRYLVRKYEG
ncbi:hypothetical protein FHW36_107269 [Chitinophaga polysaccharea]|uniref:Uncharacterized protein n=1 Tax=Chitinophaga polysaccharea TaxID=1293035 RepID=A0A561PGU1_9BACT|nr:hypothetical protein FHW36_107269 [Chitinophaga polysaccharea]